MTPEQLAGAVDRLRPLDPQESGIHPADRTDLDDRRDLVSRALYAALAHRGPGALLIADDDHLGTGEHGGPLAGWLFVTRTTPGGARRYGAAPGAETVADVLRLEQPQAVTGPDSDAHHTERDGDESATDRPPWKDGRDDPPPF